MVDKIPVEDSPEKRIKESLSLIARHKKPSKTDHCLCIAMEWLNYTNKKEFTTKEMVEALKNYCSVTTSTRGISLILTATAQHYYGANPVFDKCRQEKSPVHNLPKNIYCVNNFGRRYFELMTFDPKDLKSIFPWLQKITLPQSMAVLFHYLELETLTNREFCFLYFYIKNKHTSNRFTYQNILLTRGVITLVNERKTGKHDGQYVFSEQFYESLFWQFYSHPERPKRTATTQKICELWQNGKLNNIELIVFLAEYYGLKEFTMSEIQELILWCDGQNAKFTTPRQQQSVFSSIPISNMRNKFPLLERINRGKYRLTKDGKEAYHYLETDILPTIEKQI